ncbi:formimidoylglutamase [Persicobacter diffluens]|uniref:Arginase n=1 Tax=Persicobacter diffluens TaxID=981 RepID=A0AAN4VZN9_9BACT|nr:arginase [Persicobacter diffluens]
MLNFELFLSPIPEPFFGEDISFAKNTIGEQIQIFRHQFPSLEEVDIAFIGIEENGGDESNMGVSQAPMEIRKKLYRLKKGANPYRIADLGNIRNGLDPEETCGRLREVCAMLLHHNILPLIFGGTHDFTVGQYQAYLSEEKKVSLLNIDAFLDLTNDTEVPFNRNFLQKIILQTPNILDNFAHLAYQTYLCDPEELEKLQSLSFDTIRLGDARADIKAMEPIIRSTQLLSFDVAAIRSSDAPGSTYAQPFGLTGEEACQICWYAGINNDMSSIGFYEYNPFEDDDQMKTASVIATMIWYFIEGFYNRKNEAEFESQDFMQYLVKIDIHDEPIKFYKSLISGKWWVEVPNPNPGKPRFWRVPCGYSDYQQAVHGELPDRWFVTLSRNA